MEMVTAPFSQADRLRCILRLSVRLFFGAVLFLASCGTPNAPEPGDPCAGKKPLTADFRICAVEPLYDGTAVWLEADTMNVSNFVGLEALAEADEYQWWIGDELEPRSGKRVVVEFRESKFKDRRYNVTLIVKRKVADSVCLPGDILSDTLQKSFYLTEFTYSKMEGTYFGSLTGPVPQDTMSVEIYYYQREYATEPLPGYRTYCVRNIQPGCWGKGTSFDLGLSGNYSTGSFQAGEGFRQDEGDSISSGMCVARYGWVHQRGDSITIQYTVTWRNELWYYPDGKGTKRKEMFIYPLGTYTFKGVRIAPGKRMPGWRIP